MALFLHNYKGNGLIKESGHFQINSRN